MPLSDAKIRQTSINCVQEPSKGWSFFNRGRRQQEEQQQQQLLRTAQDQLLEKQDRIHALERELDEERRRKEDQLAKWDRLETEFQVRV